LRSFGDQLKLFSLSLDIVDQDRFNRVNSMIERYCHDVLHIHSIKLWVAGDVDGRTALRRHSLGSFEVENVKSIKEPDGSYSRQTSIAFDKGTPLWIVSSSGKQKLENSSAYKDLWSGLRSLPTYKPVSADSSIRTSIIIPLKIGGVVSGVLDFETEEYLEITDDAKSELMLIGQTLGNLLRLLRGSEVRKNSTELALEYLGNSLNRHNPKLTKPNVFLASSSRAETDVIDVIRDALKLYEDRLNLIYWKSMDSPGNITNQLLKAIGSCRYGICYFSEKNDENEYVDNANVLFEAGMFHGRIDELASEPSSWIPIREEQSNDLPFDFAQERIIWVTRNKKGELNTKNLAASIRRSVDAMLCSE
jgi:hypothetical protein